MCGICGYIGERSTIPVLLSGLERLEYRGYDSAGIAIYHEGSIKVIKAEGRLQVLVNLIASQPAIEAHMGIGHTRWATHGAPSDVNSHPHISGSGRFAVVHNGIIENYVALKKMLQSKGFIFCSETDTEVVAHLLDYFDDGDFISTIGEVIKVLEGSYALGIINSEHDDCFAVVRKDSPLIVGLSQGENFIASDIPSLLPYTKDIYYLEDKEIALLYKDKVDVFDIEKNKIAKEVCQINWDIAAAEKGGYEHFMLKEIMEQPKALADTIRPRLQNGDIVLDDFNLTKEQLQNFSSINIVACGSSYHVGAVGKYIIEELTRIPVTVDLASEFRYRNPIIDDRSLVILISQSGETADTLAALREAKAHGARTLSIVNVLGSSIAKASDDVLYTWAGPEIAVATTKAYSTQLAVIYLLALKMAELLGLLTPEAKASYINQLEKLPEQVKFILQNKELIQSQADKFYNRKSIFFIGRNIDYASSLEASLKLKEISYIHSEAYAGGELKHGTISLIENGTLVVALCSYEALIEKMISNIKEVSARGAVVITVTGSDSPELAEISAAVFKVPQTAPIFLPSLAIIPMQLFAYYVSLAKGCSIDKPRNLAKSVTVE